MSKRVKVTILLFCTVTAVLFGLFAYFSLKSQEVLASRLPLFSGSTPYAVVETDGNHFPVSLSALLTEGQFALLREGSAGSNIFRIAQKSAGCALLIEDGNENSIDIYAVIRLLPEEASSLSKGSLPKSWKMVIGNAQAVQTRKKGAWEIMAEDSGPSIYYSTDGDKALLSNGMDPFSRMLDVRSGAEKGIPKNFWREEKSWPAHIEICDGGLLFAGDGKKSSLILRAAWRDLESNINTGKTGEAIWKIKGLDKRISPIFLNALKAKTWDTANSIIPEPLLLSAGMNIPRLSGEPKDWPFPLKTIGELGLSMGLNIKQVQDILAGGSIFSVGGYNKLLWFSLPGLMAEFTGDKDLMKELVDSFWNRLFFGAEPRPIEGFSYGGTTNVPFSVVGAGRGNMAILGLLSPESLKETARLDTFLSPDQKAIGWIVADLPRIGAALSDMTKMNAFMNDSSMDDEPYYDDGSGDFFQPESSFSPFDQGISDSFGNVLKGMGKTLIIWETAESGRINWYSSPK